jgi:hypothetical protein
MEGEERGAVSLSSMTAHTAKLAASRSTPVYESTTQVGALFRFYSNVSQSTMCAALRLGSWRMRLNAPRRRCMHCKFWSKRRVACLRSPRTFSRICQASLLQF